MQPFVIALKGLKAGGNDFLWHADGEFFGTFENSEILDADLEIKVHVEYEDSDVEVSCRIDGDVTVICDRCLGRVVLPVHTSFEENETLDLNQDIYDFVCISLPLQKVHPEGGCDEETIKYLSK